MECRIPLAKRPNSELAPIAAPDREYQELWFALSREAWQTVVIVPADSGTSVVHIASALGEVARWLREPPITIITMSEPLDYVAGPPNGPHVHAEDQGGSGREHLGRGKVIVAVQAVIAEPLGLAVTRSADAVVLCIEMGRSRLASVRRTIALIGRERIRGCVLVH